jgi:hypothetical protein
MKLSKAGSLFVRIITALGACAVLLFSSAPVQADVAPPHQPPGANPIPGNQQTQVQMAAETVVITVQTTPFWIKSSWPNAVNDWAKVKASFTMHNQGSAAENMQVQFPLENPNGGGNGNFGYPLIQNFAVQVNGAPVNITKITTPNPLGGDNPPVHWASFGVTFPAGQDVHIDVSYAEEATGYIPVDMFEYILETGAGWQGPIGSADLSLVLPYPAGPENVLVGSATFKGAFSGNKVTWHYDNLEPTSEDNLEVTMLQPGVWNESVAAQAAVASQPNSSEAWGSLARAYKHAVISYKGFLRQDDGGKKLFDLAVQAYQKAIAISPNVAKWHAGYAELLWPAAYTAYPLDNNYLTQALQEIQRALQLDPTNQQARTLAEAIGNTPGIISIQGAGYDFLALTATLTPQVFDTNTPEATQTPAAALALAPTETLAPPPSETAVLQPKPSRASATPPPAIAKKTNGPLLPCCGSLFILPFLAAWVWISRRQ